jgi:hypothetical protein
VHHSKGYKKAFVGAGLLAAVGAGHAAGPTNEELKVQIEQLQAVVQGLQKQIQGQASSQTDVQQSAAPTGNQGDAATKGDIEGLRTDLENYKYEQKRNRETKTALTTRGTTIGGSIQTRASYQSPGTRTGSTATSATRSSSFDVPQAKLNLSGSLYRDYSEGRNLDYRVEFAYAKTSPAADNSNFNLSDAYIRYSPLPTLTGLEDPRLTLTFGQQLIPFGLEAQTGEELRPVINNAQFVNNLGVGTRQIGFVVRGDFAPNVDYGFNYRAPLFEYAFGTVNGSGPNKSDDNNHKDLLARLAFTLPADYNSVFRELKFGVSGYKGRQNLSTTSGTTTTLAGQGKRDRYGADIYYNHAPFGATYEYAEGRDGVPGNRPQIKSRGQTLTLFYTRGEQWFNSSRNQAKYDDWWPKSYQLFARVDKWDPNTVARNDKSDIYTAGFNLFFAETTKFQINFNRYKFEDPTKKKINELLAQFQYGF